MDRRTFNSLVLNALVGAQLPARSDAPAPSQERFPFTPLQVQSLAIGATRFVKQAESVAAYYAHARDNGTDIKFFNFATIPLPPDAETVGGQISFSTDAKKARIELNLLPLWNAIREMKGANFSDETIIGRLARAYSFFIAHELGHLKLQSDLQEKFPLVKICIPCTEHETIAFAVQSLFLNEASRKDFTIPQSAESFNEAMTNGAKEVKYNAMFSVGETKLLAAAWSGQKEFLELSQKHYIQEFSQDNAVKICRSLIKAFSELELTKEQKMLYMTEEQRLEFMQAAKDTLAAFEADPELAKKIQSFLLAEQEAILTKMRKTFDWKD